MKLLVSVILFFCFFSCTINEERKIKKDIFLHDNSSKVWLVDKMTIGKRDYTPVQEIYKQVIVFHENNSMYVYILKDIGEKPGKKMTFYLDNDKKHFSFISGRIERKFFVKFMNRTKIILKPLNKTYPYTIELIPFPEM